MKYIGTKLIEAVPARRIKTQGKVLIHEEDTDWTEEEVKLEKEIDARVEAGYKVTYPDGYVSWSPKDVFEKAYLPMIANAELRDSDAPSISQEMVDDFIQDVEVMRMGSTTTVVKATLRNGFTIVEASSCVSAGNYDEDVGTAICMEKIQDQVWSHLGFLLATAVNGIKKMEETAEVPTSVRADPDAYIRREVL